MDGSVYEKLVHGCCELIKKDKEKISVSSLCRAADISRATFYLYYEDLKSFFEEFEKKTANNVFRQAECMLLCDDSELINAVKKENLLINDEDAFLIKYINSENRYISLSEVSYNCLKEWDYGKLKPEKNLKEFIIFMNGFISVVYNDMLCYDKQTMLREMKMSRAFYNVLMKL